MDPNLGQIQGKYGDCSWQNSLLKTHYNKTHPSTQMIIIYMGT